MRHALAAIAAVLVLAGAVGGAYWWLDQQIGAPAADRADPADTADAYLEAWSAGDHAAMAELVRAPDDRFVADHEQLREGLEATGLTAELAELTTDVDGRATARATVRVATADLGSVDWEVELRLLRERGDWGVAWEPATLHPAWRPGLRFAVVREDAGRRPIVADDGTQLAGPGERVTYGFDPADVPDLDDLADAFDAAVEGSGDQVRRLAEGGGLVEGWFYPVVSLPADEARERTTDLRGRPGVLRRTESGARTLLADGFAWHLVGRVAEATAEQLDQLGAPYEVGDRVGQFGLEAALERELATSTTLAAVLRDGTEGPVRATLGAARVDGTGQTTPLDLDADDEADPLGEDDALRTTVDVAVQRAIENTLLARTTATGMVVVDGEDGALRGAASRPLEGFDRALTGRYAPGVAITPLVADAGAASGQDAPDTDALVAAATRLGFDDDPRLPVPAFAGSFPAPVDPAEAARVRGGQGRAEVSVLHAASLVAAATGGSWHAPWLLHRDGPGEAVPLSAGATDRLRSELSAGPAGLSVTAGTASGTGGVSLGWAIGTVDGLGVAVLVEGGDGEEAQDLLGRFARELAALRERPSDLDEVAVP